MHIIIILGPFQQLPLRDGSKSLEKWSNVTVPIYFRVYIFDVTNTADVEERNAIPIVEQCGPYTFLEKREKRVLDFTNNSEIIEYKDIKTFFFQPQLSNGSLDDQVSMLNVPLMVRK